MKGGPPSMDFIPITIVQHEDSCAFLNNISDISSLFWHPMTAATVGYAFLPEPARWANSFDSPLGRYA